MTTVRTVHVFTSIIFFIATLLLSGEVFAQSENSQTETATTSPVISNVATTSTTTLPVETTEEVSWFRTERISGNVNQGDFVVGPGRTELELSPGETVVQEISITNRISDNRIFELQIEDITGSSDGSAAVSLTGEERGPYSIRDYLSFPADNFRLELGERARVPVTISVPPDAEPGGYYGSVLVSTIQADGPEVANAGRQPIIARIGSLIFLRVKGETVIEGETKSVDLIEDKLWYERGPIKLGILYENTGSVHVNPYGQLSITNMFGEEVGFVELEPWFVLPNSLRVRELDWDREFLLGRYTVKAEINRGYDDIIDTVTVSFWVLPWKIVGGTFLVIFTIFFLFRAFFRTFEFKRKS